MSDLSGGAGKLACPSCGHGDTRVVDSRLTVHGEVRRRRKCTEGHRFTTYETVLPNRIEDDAFLVALDDLDKTVSDAIRHLRRTRLQSHGSGTT